MIFPINAQSSLIFPLQVGHPSFEFSIIKEKLCDTLFSPRKEFAALNGAAIVKEVTFFVVFFYNCACNEKV